MTPNKFETLCRNSNLRPIYKQFGDEEIYIAEGYCERGQCHTGEMAGTSHHEILWAVSRGENMSVAQVICVPYGSTHSERLQLALDEAVQFIKGTGFGPH